MFSKILEKGSGLKVIDTMFCIKKSNVLYKKSNNVLYKKVNTICFIVIFLFE